jgi:hypothetical protein
MAAPFRLREAPGRELEVNNGSIVEPSAERVLTPDVCRSRHSNAFTPENGNGVIQFARFSYRVAFCRIGAGKKSLTLHENPGIGSGIGSAVSSSSPEIIAMPPPRG